MAVQSVFALLDVLTLWSSKVKSKLDKLKSKRENEQDKVSLDISVTSTSSSFFTATGSASASASNGKTKESDTEESPVRVNPGQCIHALLAAVPRALLGHAALRIKAYARALRYFESHAREARDTTQSSSSSTSTVKPISDVDPSKILKPTPPTLLALMHSPRNDGSNGELPALEVSQLDALVEVYSSLEDPDALQGVQKLR